MVEQEACECGVIDIICIDTIVVPIPIHLEPDLVPHLQMEEHRARGLVHILFLILVVGEEHGLVLLEEAHLHVLHVHRDVVGEVVEAWNVAVKFASAAVIMILLVVEDLSKANGNIGDRDAGLQPHAECRAMHISSLSRFSFPAGDPGKAPRSFSSCDPSISRLTLRTKKT